MSDSDLNQQKVDLFLDSEEFDPNLALFGGENYSVQVPVPEAKVFNNLAEYYSKTFPKKSESSAKESHTNVARFSKWTSRGVDNTEKRAYNPISVFDKMKLSKGPISILYCSLNNQIKVLVRRRKNCFLREERFCWINGTLLAFDKHFNLALKDVCEQFTHRDNVKETIVKIKKLSNQLFIRGDNIILVSRQL